MYKYQHGGNIIFEKDGVDILDLSANINPLGYPENVKNAILEEIDFINRYPDNYSRKLVEKIANFENVPKDYIFCGNGASDIIFRLPLAIKPKKVMVLAPTFSDYERAVQSYGAEIFYYILKEENGFLVNDANHILDSIKRNKIDMIFICNPNNPTGLLTERNIIESILEYGKDNNIKVVIDECFIDFTEDSDKYTCKPLLKKYKNLIILKAFTKIFAIPGVRLGYSLCSDEVLINKLYFSGADWPISNFAQGAGIASLTNCDEYLKNTVLFIKKQGDKIKYELEKLNFEVFDSKANYIFFKSNYEYDIKEKLEEKNIVIRSCSNYNGVDKKFYRVAISTEENNKLLIENLKLIVNR